MSSVGDYAPETGARRRLSDEVASVAASTDQEHEPKRRRIGVIRPARVQRRKAACQVCRSRKVKCDNVRPTCGSCAADGSNCVYVDPPPDQPVLDPTTSVVLNRLDQILEGVHGISHELGRQSLSLPSHSGSWRQRSSAVTLSPQDSGDLTIATEPNGFEPASAPSKDYLRVPTCVSSADTMLMWPIFKGKFLPQSLVRTVFRATPDQTSGPIGMGDDTVMVRTGLVPLADERIPTLIDRFLENVHTKNPILDTDALVRYGREAAANGPGWDAPSCLVLLACALGAVSYPFNVAVTDKMGFNDASASSVGVFERELQLAESCYVLACRRLGLLKQTVLGSQCYFFSGVYLMYTFRPLLAWNHFTQASTCYRLYLRSAEESHLDSSSGQALNATSTRRHRLEQSLYWSCFKSECEFRVEMPLNQTEIADVEHPHMFPSPPSPPDEGARPKDFGYDPSSMTWSSRKQITEEQSWYYYLTELALRRMGNRILNTFYQGSHHEWNRVLHLIPAAKEFEIQISAWSANLPSVMQYETKDASDVSPSNELSWCTGNRLLEIQAWLYQPFIYHALHNPGWRRNPEHTGLRSLVEAGLETYLRIIQMRTIRHRHHGLWFDLRSITTCAIFFCAALMSGSIKLPVDWEQRYDQILLALKFWEGESPDLAPTRHILEELRREARLARGA